MIDLETLAASCATRADEIVARGSSDTFRYDADGVLIREYRYECTMQNYRTFKYDMTIWFG